MTRVAIVGYGNIGRYALDALKAAPDMECAGVVRRCGVVKDCIGSIDDGSTLEGIVSEFNL